jgi:hypothetical protein
MDDLEMHWASAKFVPRLLTDDQKLQQFPIFENLIQRANDDENYHCHYQRKDMGLQLRC